MFIQVKTIVFPFIINCLFEIILYLLNKANWEEYCKDVDDAYCHTHADRTEGGHGNAKRNKRDKQGITPKLLQSLEMGKFNNVYDKLKK